MKYIVLSVALCINTFSLVSSNSDKSLEQRLQETQVILEARLSHLQRELARLKLEKCTKNDIDIVVLKKLESNEYVKNPEFHEINQRLESLLQKLAYRIDELGSRLQNLEVRFNDMQKASECKVLLAHQVAGLQFTIQDLESRIVQLERQETLVRLDKTIHESFPGSPQEIAPIKLVLETVPPTPAVSNLTLTANIFSLLEQKKDLSKNNSVFSLDSND